MNGEMDLSEVRAGIREVLAKQPETVTSWVLMYEASGIDGDGDLTNRWGAVLSASSSTVIGMCELLKADVLDGSVE